jgi:hypothetical protein
MRSTRVTNVANTCKCTLYSYCEPYKMHCRSVAAKTARSYECITPIIKAWKVVLVNLKLR